MRIMIFGGAGFIGSHVADLLHKNQSNQLFIFDDLSTGKHENVRHLISEKHNTRIKFDMQDIRKSESVDDAVCRFRPEVIILLAAQASISKSETDPKNDMEVTIRGMLNVISSARRFEVNRIIFSSTSAVYKDKRWGKLNETDDCSPKSPYGISKMAAELYLRTQFKNSVILRFGNVYGPRQTTNQLIPSMIQHFYYGCDFKIFGDGKQTRDYIYVDDAAEAVQDAIVGDPWTYNIASGKRVSVNDVAKTLCEAQELPDLYPFEHSEEPDPRRDICLDVRAANEYLGWKPRISFRDGMKRTVEWWQERTRAQPRSLNIPISYDCEVVKLGK